MTSAGIQKLVKRLGERAGVTNVHAHRFRRTAATLARMRGMPNLREPHTTKTSR